MEILPPIKELNDWLKNFPKSSRESGQPQKLTDAPEDLAKLLGRSRVTYEPVWQAVERNSPSWTPVLCNSYRRALLLASSAIQHRTQAYNVWRRGRIVLIRLVQDSESPTTEPQRATA